jgi:hypothetical protein
LSPSYLDEGRLAAVLPDDTGAHCVHDAVAATFVSAEDCSSQSVDRVIGYGHGFLFGAKFLMRWVKMSDTGQCISLCNHLYLL